MRRVLSSVFFYLTALSTTYTPEEQTQLLEDAAIAMGYKSWADYQRRELDWSDPEWDY